MKLFDRLRGRLRPDPAPAPPVDLDAELERIRAAEAKGIPDPGRLIHRFDYDDLTLRLDRDVTGAYRVTAMQGRERRYSFTLHADPGDYDALRDALSSIVDFLRTDRRPARLPDDERLKGHFYG